MTPLDDIVAEMLRLATNAGRLYVSLSGSKVQECPEFFIQSYVFDHMRKRLTRSLEVKTDVLWSYYCNYALAQEGRRLDPKAVPKTLAERGRQDMVIYRDDVERKEEQSPRIVVEFKRLGHDPKDINRIRAIMDAMPIFELGICLGLYWRRSLQGIEYKVSEDMARLGMSEWTHKTGAESSFEGDANVYAPVAFLRWGVWTPSLGKGHSASH